MCEGKRERAIKITFDDFLRPAVEAWRVGKPYAQLIHDIQDYKIELISSYTNLPHIHFGLDVFTRGYSSESDFEVDVENDEHDYREDDEILLFFGYPYLPRV